MIRSHADRLGYVETEPKRPGPRPGPRPYRRRAWDEPGISAELARSRVHALIREQRGPASEHPCVECGQPARDWSYTYAPGEPWVRGMYGPPERYAPRCRPCHVRYDTRISYGK